MKIVLHIGVYKTGTTAIQKFCARNRQQLLAQGVLYPEFTKHDAHHPVPWALGAFHQDRDESISAEAAIGAIRREAQASGAGTIILSSEEFRNVEPGALQIPRSSFPEATFQVLVYLRRQDDFLISEYGQHVRMYSLRFSGTVYDFYLKYNLARRYNYWVFLESWAKVFGDAAVTPRIYDRRQFPGGNVIADFLGAANVVGDGLDMEQEANVNRNLSAVGLEILRRSNMRPLNEMVHMKLLRLLDKTFAEDDQSYYLLSEKNRKDIMALFGHSNAMVAKKWLGREDGKLFDLDDPAAPSTLPYDGSDHRIVADALLESLLRVLRQQR